MANAALYQNLPLPSPAAKSRPCIRLLKMDWDDTTLRTTLKVFSLSQCPAYKALSYTWGDPENPRRWNCNGVDILVTENLARALMYFTFDYVGQWLWIDAICINQSDAALREREHQVSIMRDIYSGADEVLVWLGPAILGENMDLLCIALREYAIWMRLYVQLLGVTEVDLGLIGRTATDLALQSRPFSGMESQALTELLRQPYWNRVWIIQELCVPKEVRIHIDLSSIVWEDFKWSLIMLERCMPHEYRGLEANLRALLDLRRGYHETNSGSQRRLSDLLPLFRWSQASDKLDKIYSLLGLVTEEDRGFVPIKYKVPLRKCYTPIMFALLKQTGDLSPLLHCGAPGFVHSRTTQPSWVVDWAYDASHLPRPRWHLRETNVTHAKAAMTRAVYLRYHASSTSECPPPKLRHGSILTLVGMTAAWIIEVGPAMELHHLPLRPEDFVRTFAPTPPLSWDVYVAQQYWKNVWATLTTLSFADLLLFPLNCYRKGAALDILLASSRLVRASGTQLRYEEDHLRCLFLTLMNGVEDYEFLQLRIVGGFLSDAPQQMANEFRAFENSLRWNLPFQLTNLIFRKTVLHSIHICCLGLSYENHRGALPLLGTFIAFLSFFLTWLMIYPSIIIPITQIMSPLGLYMSTKSLGQPANPKLIDMVPQSMLGSRVARTGNGLVALVPHATQVGDRIALLKGGRCPFVVRPWGRKWKLVGDAYVDG
ncbi:HET-domain-containing protein, partial [Ophiobolus disseminans]